MIARESICLDGTSRALGAGERALADPALTEALSGAAPAGAHRGAIVSVDLFYDARPSPTPRRARSRSRWRRPPCSPSAPRAGVPVGCVLAVSDTFDAAGARTHIDDHSLLAAAEAMGATAVAALGAVTG